jgi:SAM-dependent methyltransferase
MAFYNFFKRERSKQFKYLTELSNNSIIKYLHSEFINDDSETRKLLEIGIGQGDMKEKLQILPGHVYLGMDINFGICANFLKGSALNINAALPVLPLKEKSVDVVYLSHVIEHLFDYSTVLKFLQESNRVLSDDGRLIILFPDYDSWQIDFEDVDYSHNFPMTARRMEQLSADSGFKIKKWTDYCGIGTGLKGRLFSLMGKMIPFRLIYSLNPPKFYKWRKSAYAFNRNLIFVLQKAI